MKSYFKRQKELKKKKKNKLLSKKENAIRNRYDLENETISNYGCNEVEVSELPKYVNEMISTLNLKRPIKVSQRQKGMTSSGKPYKCHSNVETLVKNYGGKRMVGYMIQKTRIDDALDLLFHSVWVTPEGKLADVTEKDNFQKEHTFNEDNEKYQYFIPVSEREFYLRDMGIPKDYKKLGYGYGAVISHENIYKSWDSPTLNKMVVKSGINFSKTRGSRWWRDTSFRLPSTASGCYLRNGQYLLPDRQTIQ